MKSLYFLMGLMVLACVGSTSTAQTMTIVFDNIEGNGDAVTTDTPGGAGIGTITTPYAGFEFLGTAPNYFGLLDLTVANNDNNGDGTVDVDEMVVDNLPGISQAGAAADQWTVTYGGAIAAGDYTITLQLVDYNNDPFRAVSDVTLGGLTATADASNPPPLTANQDGLFSYSFTVASGAAEIGNALDLAVTANQVGSSNIGFDNVQIDFTPEAVPEPSSAFALFGLMGLATLRRSRS